jgi:hypothetical protein
MNKKLLIFMQELECQLCKEVCELALDIGTYHKNKNITLP